MSGRRIAGALLGLVVAGTSVSATEPPAAGAETASTNPADGLSLWLDEQFAERCRQEGRPVPDPVDDATFLRRVHLDLVGTIPTVSQVRDFLGDGAGDKRERVVDELLADRRGPGHLARVWRRMMIPASSPAVGQGVQFEPWLERQFAENVPYDELARRAVAARGGGTETPAAYYQAVGGTPDALADSVSRVFLGVRLGCAQCHDHPFAAWRQEDFWGLAAFFAGMRPGGPDAFLEETRVTSIRSEGTEYSARLLWSQPVDIPADRLPRDVLAEWLASRDNPNFGATAVNRVWQHLCGRGLVHPVDDLDFAREADRRLLDELGGQFAEAGFDLRWLVRGICLSRVYQQPAVGPEGAASHFAARPLKTLTPEQVFDALEQALMLPVTRSDGSPRYSGERSRLVARLEEAYGESPDDYRAGIPQVLLMMNGRLTADATSLDDSRTLRAVVEAPFLDPAQKIETLYLAAFTRPPRDNEMQVLREHVERRTEGEARRAAYAEVFWALLNSPEFVLCR